MKTCKLRYENDPSKKWSSTQIPLQRTDSVWTVALWHLKPKCVSGVKQEVGEEIKGEACSKQSLWLKSDFEVYAFLRNPETTRKLLKKRSERLQAWQNALLFFGKWEIELSALKLSLFNKRKCIPHCSIIMFVFLLLNTKRPGLNSLLKHLG